MSFHQSSVYAGTIAGGTLAGYLGSTTVGGRSFYVFGWGGIALALCCWVLLREPERERVGPGGRACRGRLAAGGRSGDVFRHPMAPVLMAVFVGANFVAAIFLTWLPSFLFRKFR